jgi:hypothetical protein
MPSLASVRPRGRNLPRANSTLSGFMRFTFADYAAVSSLRAFTRGLLSMLRVKISLSAFRSGLYSSHVRG